MYNKTHKTTQHNTNNKTTKNTY